MRPQLRHPRPHGGAAGVVGGGAYSQAHNYFPQNPDPQFPFNPQFYQQQQQQQHLHQLFFQNPNFQNPHVQTPLNVFPQVQNTNFQNPYIQAPPAPVTRTQNVSLNSQVTMEKVEGMVAKAHRDLITAGENVTAWKVSQASLVSLQVDSWSSLGFQLQDVPTLRRLLAIEGKMNAFIHCFVGAQRITSLYDLEMSICKNEGIERFEELGLGPLSRHPLVHHYFSTPSDSIENFKISSEDVIASLCSFMKNSNKRVVSAEELLDFLAEQKSVPCKEKLGVRIQSLGLHVAFIRQAEKAEKTILSKSLGKSKCNREEKDSTALPHSAHMQLEKQMLNKRFDSISDRVKSFSSVCNVSSGKHIRFDCSSDDECDVLDDNVDGKDINRVSYQISSNDSCPYPSATEEMIRLGLKSDTSEKANSLQDKLTNIWGRSAGKKQKRKQKRKRQEKHDDTMNKFIKKDISIDFGNKLESVTLPDSSLDRFITTWRDSCREHSAAEVLDLMINFYMASSTEKKKRKVREIFSTLPGLVLLDVAVISIKRGLLDSVYDTIQIFGEHGSDSSPEIMIPSKPSVKEESLLNTTKDIDDRGYRVTVDDIIKNVAEFFRHDIVMPIERDVSSGELFNALKNFCACESWLAAQFSVKEFSSLGHGSFFTFLEEHASFLPNELYSFLSRKSPEPSRVEASILEHHLEILLCQAESNLFHKGGISKSDISLMLKKQFPTISFQIVGNEPEKCFMNLVNRQKDQNNSSCIMYSMSLLGKHSTRDLLAFQEKHLAEDTLMGIETVGEIYSHGNVTSKEAIDCLLKVPMLSDLLYWSHWDVLYAPSLGSLSDWLLNEVDVKELKCIATMDGKFIRIDQSATTDEFLEAMVQSSPFQVALKLLSLLSLYGGVSNVPVSLLKCYVQQAVDISIRNSTNSAKPRLDEEDLMHNSAWQGQVARDLVANIDTCSVENQEGFESIRRGCVLSESLGGFTQAVRDVSRFILQCLDYLPSEFRSFGSDILVSGLRSVAKDANSVMLRECSQTSQRLMLHDIGLSLGISEWIDDFHEFSSVATDLFPSSATLNRTSVHSGSGGSSIHAGDTCEKHVSNHQSMSGCDNADASDADANDLYNGDNAGEYDAILANGHVKRKDFDGAVSESRGIVENSIVKDAASVIESIRREEFGLDPTLDYSESCMLKKQHARLGRALHCLSQELYSQDSHLLLELVQNADDNIYPEDADPALVFILQEAGIVVLNNELGFSADNIRALCDIGNSTKKGSGAGYIGHKGIGFKSVFRVTDAPEIHSNGFHVKFDITEGQIGFVLPTVIPPCNIDVFREQLSGERYSNNDARWNTCIVLPFRSKSIEGTGMASIIAMFSDLHPSLLLFLHRLKCIKFMNMLDNTLVNMRRETVGNGIVKVSHGQDTMTWLVISKKVPANLIRPDVQSTEIALAFTLEECESGEYKPHISQQPVFAFLPLRNYGLKFILQGDFVLPSSREEVDGNSAWNQWLLSEFPALFVSAEQSFCSLPCFQDRPGKAVSVYMSFVPLVGEVHGFFSHLPHMVISKLRTSSCLPLDGPDLTWVLPCRVLRGWNEQVRMLLCDGLLQKHIGLGYLSKDIELSDALAKALGVQDYGPKVLIQIVSSVCRSKDDIKSLGLDWLSAWLDALYLALSTHSSGHYSSNAQFEHDIIYSLRKIPFIPLSDGSYSSVVDGPIWLPCDASSVGIEGKYRVADFPNLYAKLRTVNPLLLAAAPNMYTVEEVKSDNIVHMLRKIGVQQLSAHEVIKNHNLVALSKDKCMDDDRNLMIEYLSFILLHFQYDCARCCFEKKDIISELRKSPVLLTNHGYKCPINEPVHFGREYENPVDIKKLIGTLGNEWHEVDAAYIMHPSIQSLQCGVMQCRKFFLELGVTDFVQVSCIRRNALDIPHTFLGDMRPDGDLTFASSFINDWESSELLYFLSAFSSNKCREKCIYLLEVLDKMWDNFYNEYARCHITSKTNEGMEIIQSSFMKSLREFKWIASSTDYNLHQSKELFYDCDEVRSILGNLASYAVPQITSKLLRKDIGFRTEVSLDDALRILHSQKMSKSHCMTSILQMSKFYSFISNELIRSKAKINEELTSGSFIFVPFMRTTKHDTVSGMFLPPKELYWHDPTGCVDKTKELIFCSSTKDNDCIPCKALATIYPGLYDFFVNICGVPKIPQSGSYLQILLQLSSNALPSQAAHLVFQVFAKWADDMKSGSVNPGEILELKENLLKLECTVLPTLQDKWVSLHPSFGLICWPDDDGLKQQFKHAVGVDFLHFGELSREDQDKLSGTVSLLMNDIGVPKLSEIVSRKAIFYGTHDSREKVYVINWILPYAQRYIYKMYPDIYLNLKRLKFEKISQLEVIVVDKLFYKNCLQGRGSASTKRFECSCILQGSTVYTTFTADSHSIFMELSRLFFNGSTELQFANFLHMITTMAESGSNSEQVEFFILNSQKIPMLPAEEPVWCLSSSPELPKVEHSEPVLASTNMDQNTSTAPKRPCANQNWPPTGWRTAPDISYAHANYHLTRPWVPPSLRTEKGSNKNLDVIPLTEEIPIPIDIHGEWMKGEDSTAATETLIQDSIITNYQPNLESFDSADGLVNPNSEPNNEACDSVHVPTEERVRLGHQPHDDSQLWKTGRLGEVIAYKYFVNKLGPLNVRWVNEETETGLPYDLTIGVDESSKEYIEVKATRYASKDWFELSTREWQCAIERGDSYSIAQVVLGARKASITVLKNPFRLCQQNALRLALLMSKQVKDSSVPT